MKINLTKLGSPKEVSVLYRCVCVCVHTHAHTHTVVYLLRWEKYPKVIIR